MRRAVRFVVAWGTVAFLWLIVLPWIGSFPAVQAKIAREEAAGIDPSAKFYTELEAMGRLSERLDGIRHANHDAFWRRSIGGPSAKQTPGARP